VKAYISKTSTNLSHCIVEKRKSKPASYGIYLGEFASPPTCHQVQLLAQWDLLIFDPARQGIVDAMLSGLYVLPSQSLARLDVEHVAGSASQKPIISVVEWIRWLMEVCKVISSHQNIITGVLIGNWEQHLTPPLLREVVFLVNSLGLSVYLEATAPKFLSDPKLAELDEVTGIVIRNGTISPNGEERDAFQMAEMRPTIKAFVSQACLRSFVVLLWETLDDEVTPLNAVVKRSYQWARFYSALPWIGSRTALTAAELSLRQEEPLGAFDWLKEIRVMKLHDKWRSNKHVSAPLLHSFGA
jgi:hypothetical protein